MRMPTDETGKAVQILQPNKYAVAAIGNVSNNIDLSNHESDAAYLVAEVAINYSLTGAATRGASHYLPADTILPLSIKDVANVAVIAAIADETGNAYVSDLK